MPYLEMLVGIHGDENSALVEAIDALDDASTLFVAAWSQGKREQAQRASDAGNASLDHVVNLILRERDNYRRSGIYAGSQFENSMLLDAGIMMPGATSLDHQSVGNAPPGQGVMPTSAPSTTINFGKLLNKIKHRNRDYVNFRLSSTSHSMIICPDKTDATPDSVVEFDLGEFCILARIVKANI